MKKLLSIILTCAMIMSLFCVVPVSAEGSTYPYILYDFEDITDAGATDTTSGSWNGTGSTEGVSGGKALYRESTGTSSASYASFTFANKRVPSFMTSGEKFKLSFWFKVDSTKTRFDTTKASSTFRVVYMVNNGTRGSVNYDFKNVDFDALNSGEWIYFEQEATWDGTTSYSDTQTYDSKTNPDEYALTMSFRLGKADGSKPVDVLQEGYNSAYAVAIDDFCIEPVSDSPVYGAEAEPTVVWENLDAKIDTSSGGQTNVTIGETTRRIYKQMTGSHDSTDSGKYINVMYNSNTYWNNGWTANLAMDYNKLYKVSFYARAADAANVGTHVGIRLYRSFRQDTKNDPNSNYYLNSNVAWDCYNGIDVTDTWQKCEIYVKRNVKTFDRSKLRIYMDYRAAEGVTLNVDIDDIVIEEYAVPTNGGFENLAYPKQVNHYQTSTMANDSEKYVTNMYGWLAEGATVTADTTAPHSGTQAAKVVTTDAGGSAYQGVFFENGTTKKITFYAKGEGDSIGKPISVVLDRAVAEIPTKDVYDVPNTETLSVTGADGTNLLTDTWKRFTVEYSPNFELGEGKTMPTLDSKSGIGPRQPMLKFNVGDSSAGMTYYLDDLTINDPWTVPYVTDITSTGALTEGNTVTLSYIATTDVASTTMSNTYARVLAEVSTGKYAIVSRITDTNSTGTISYQIPAGLAHKKLVLEVLPTDASGNVGSYYTKELGTVAAEEENPIVGITFTATTTNATVVSADALTGKVIWVAYNADGKMTSCVHGDIEVGEQGTETISIPSGFVVDETVKVMLWKDMLTTCEPLADLVLID